jgi:sulfide:quinone oxidoreductase
MKIVIIGGSFGGLTAAHELRRLLRAREHEITLISKDQRFVFIPALPWVAMGTKSLEQISFDLEGPLTRKGIRFVHATVRQVDAKSQMVYSHDGEHCYDYLVIATGHRSANEAVPGLGPFDGPGHSLVSPPEAEEAREAWANFLQDS